MNEELVSIENGRKKLTFTLALEIFYDFSIATVYPLEKRIDMTKINLYNDTNLDYNKRLQMRYSSAQIGRIGGYIETSMGIVSLIGAGYLNNPAIGLIGATVCADGISRFSKKRHKFGKNRPNGNGWVAETISYLNKVVQISP